MVNLGGTASIAHLKVFQGLEKCFRRQGIDLEWVLYSNDEAVVDAFVNGEIDPAWNSPLNYVKIKRRRAGPQGTPSGGRRLLAALSQHGFCPARATTRPLEVVSALPRSDLLQ